MECYGSALMDPGDGDSQQLSRFVYENISDDEETETKPCLITMGETEVISPGVKTGTENATPLDLSHFNTNLSPPVNFYNRSHVPAIISKTESDCDLSSSNTEKTLDICQSILPSMSDVDSANECNLSLQNVCCMTESPSSSQSEEVIGDIHPIIPVYGDDCSPTRKKRRRKNKTHARVTPKKSKKKKVQEAFVFEIANDTAEIYSFKSEYAFDEDNATKIGEANVSVTNDAVERNRNMFGAKNINFGNLGTLGDCNRSLPTLPFEIAPPRKRGRPRKTATVTATVSVSTSSTSEDYDDTYTKMTDEEQQQIIGFRVADVECSGTVPAVDNQFAPGGNTEYANVPPKKRKMGIKSALKEIKVEQDTSFSSGDMQETPSSSPTKNRGTCGRPKKSKKKKKHRIGRPPVIGQFKCDRCELVFKERPKLIKHRKTHVRPFIYCSYCDFKARSRGAFLEHESRHTKAKPFQCELCTYASRSRIDLQRHQAKHSKVKNYKCPYCDFTTKWKRNVSSHLLSHVDDRPFNCEICGHSFKRSCDLKYHLYRHTSEKPLGCAECGFRCKTNYELNLHKFKHSDVRSFPCTHPGCPQACKTKSDLAKHMHVHSEERKYPCPLCGKYYKSPSARNKHTQRHTDERPFTCHICNKTFKVKSSLGKHLQLHNGIRPYSCDVCDRTFANKSNKRAHMITHDLTNRPYRCPLCPYGGKSQQNLLAHVGTMHGNYAFFCELCKKPYKRHSQLQLHYKRMHSKKELEKLDNLDSLDMSHMTLIKGEEDEAEEGLSQDEGMSEYQSGMNRILQTIKQESSMDEESATYPPYLESSDMKKEFTSTVEEQTYRCPEKKKRGRPRKKVRAELSPCKKSRHNKNLDCENTEDSDVGEQQHGTTGRPNSEHHTNLTNNEQKRSDSQQNGQSAHSTDNSQSGHSADNSQTIEQLADGRQKSEHSADNNRSELSADNNESGHCYPEKRKRGRPRKEVRAKLSPCKKSRHNKNLDYGSTAHSDVGEPQNGRAGRPNSEHHTNLTNDEQKRSDSQQNSQKAYSADDSQIIEHSTDDSQKIKHSADNSQSDLLADNIESGHCYPEKRKRGRPRKEVRSKLSPCRILGYNKNLDCGNTADSDVGEPQSGTTGRPKPEHHNDLINNEQKRSDSQQNSKSAYSADDSQKIKHSADNSQTELLTDNSQSGHSADNNESGHCYPEKRKRGRPRKEVRAKLSPCKKLGYNKNLDLGNTADSDVWEPQNGTTGRPKPEYNTDIINNEHKSDSLKNTQSVHSTDNSQCGHSADDSQTIEHSADDSQSELSADNSQIGPSADNTQSCHSADNSQIQLSADNTQSRHSADNSQIELSSDNSQKSEHSADNQIELSADNTQSEHSADISQKIEYSVDDSQKSEHSADNKVELSSDKSEKSGFSADNSQNELSVDNSQKSEHSTDNNSSEYSADNHPSGHSINSNHNGCCIDNDFSRHLEDSDLSGAGHSRNNCPRVHSVETCTSGHFTDNGPCGNSVDNGPIGHSLDNVKGGHTADYSLSGHVEDNSPRGNKESSNNDTPEKHQERDTGSHCIRDKALDKRINTPRSLFSDFTMTEEPTVEQNTEMPSDLVYEDDIISQRNKSDTQSNSQTDSEEIGDNVVHPNTANVEDTGLVAKLNESEQEKIIQFTAAKVDLGVDGNSSYNREEEDDGHKINSCKEQETGIDTNCISLNNKDTKHLLHSTEHMHEENHPGSNPDRTYQDHGDEQKIGIQSDGDNLGWESHTVSSIVENVGEIGPSVSSEICPLQESCEQAGESDGIQSDSSKSILVSSTGDQGPFSESEQTLLKTRQAYVSETNLPSTWTRFDDNFRLPLATKGFRFNFKKTGKKPKCWFMNLDVMDEESKNRQIRYLCRKGRMVSNGQMQGKKRQVSLSGQMKWKNNLASAGRSKHRSLKKHGKGPTLTNISKNFVKELNDSYEFTDRPRTVGLGGCYRRPYTSRLDGVKVNKDDLFKLNKSEGTMLKPKLSIVSNEISESCMQKVKGISMTSRSLPFTKRYIKLEVDSEGRCIKPEKNYPIEETTDKGVTEKTEDRKEFVLKSGINPGNGFDDKEANHTEVNKEAFGEKEFNSGEIHEDALDEEQGTDANKHDRRQKHGKKTAIYRKSPMKKSGMKRTIDRQDSDCSVVKRGPGRPAGRGNYSKIRVDSVKRKPNTTEVKRKPNTTDVKMQTEESVKFQLQEKIKQRQVGRKTKSKTITMDTNGQIVATSDDDGKTTNKQKPSALNKKSRQCLVCMRDLLFGKKDREETPEDLMTCPACELDCHYSSEVKATGAKNRYEKLDLGSDSEENDEEEFFSKNVYVVKPPAEKTVVQNTAKSSKVYFRSNVGHIKTYVVSKEMNKSASYELTDVRQNLTKNATGYTVIETADTTEGSETSENDQNQPESVTLEDNNRNMLTIAPGRGSFESGETAEIITDIESLRSPQVHAINQDNVNSMTRLDTAPKKTTNFEIVMEYPEDTLGRQCHDEDEGGGDRKVVFHPYPLHFHTTNTAVSDGPVEASSVNISRDVDDNLRYTYICTGAPMEDANSNNNNNNIRTSDTSVGQVSIKTSTSKEDVCVNEESEQQADTNIYVYCDDVGVVRPATGMENQGQNAKVWNDSCVKTVMEDLGDETRLINGQAENITVANYLGRQVKTEIDEYSNNDIPDLVDDPVIQSSATDMSVTDVTAGVSADIKPLPVYHLSEDGMRYPVEEAQYQDSEPNSMPDNTSIDGEDSTSCLPIILDVRSIKQEPDFDGDVV